MTRKELFYSQLNVFLQTEDFELKSRGFVKKSGKNRFLIEFTTWPAFYQAELSYKCLIAEIEQVKKNAFGKAYTRRFSLGRNRFQMSGRDVEMAILRTETEEDVIQSVKEEIVFYKEKVSAFFDKSTDFVYLDNLLNNEPGKVLDIALNSIDSSFLAIVVAHLTERRNMKEILDVYGRIIKRDNSNWLSEFEMMSDYVLR